jgi:hypothetical protein
MLPRTILREQERIITKTDRKVYKVIDDRKMKLASKKRKRI